MYNILITGLGAGISYNDSQLAELGKLGNVRYQQDMSREELLEAVADCEILMTDCTVIDEGVFEAGRRLRLVVEHGVGYDNIDVAAATRHGVLVCHTPTVYTRQVAEMTVSLLFALSKDLYRAFTDVCSGKWDSAPADPRQVSEKVLGVIGCGRIGSAFIKMMQGFSMKVLVCDPYIPDERITALGAERRSFADLLAESDIISIHTPKNEETVGMINAAAFARMKDGVIILNTARGGLIDEAALAEAVKGGKVLAAAIDVIDGEADGLADCPLIGLDRVIITPHMAWKTEYSVAAVTTQCMEDVKAYASGKPVYMCNPEVWEALNVIK